MQRDQTYEAEIFKEVQESVNFLQDYSGDEPDLDRKDRYAIERVLQVLIESMIGFCRYFAQLCFSLHLAKSGEAVDVLKDRGTLSKDEALQMRKMIGFRNVLVHAYLRVDDDIIRAILNKKLYMEIPLVLAKLKEKIPSKMNKGAGSNVTDI